MTIEKLANLSEGRRIEFKGELPEKSDLAKTACAFANDAGGDIFIGITDDKRVIGLDEDLLPRYEGQISNMIYDRCYPAILPEVSFLTVENKHLIRIKIYRGSMPPYYIKEEGRDKGTYVRVGSNNRKADASIIAELERRRRNISYDSELVLEKPAKDLSLTGFATLYKEVVGEDLDFNTLKILELVKEERGEYYPTNALIWLSDDPLRKHLFPNATIDCARFKGMTTDEFIDQKHLDCEVAEQTDEAYNFILRHINKGAMVNGVFTVSHWEYPIKAVREVLRNAVAHRDYALDGKDIKVAIYDDMIEVTSPGLLPPSIDYSDMTSRQSDARNKLLAMTFKRLGIIDKWGNGLLLIREEMREYPGIELRWHEVGLSFQVQFVKKNISSYKSIEDRDVVNVVNVVNSELSEEANKVYQNLILDIIEGNERIKVAEIAEILKISARHCQRFIALLKTEGKLDRTGKTRNGHWIVNRKTGQ